MPPLISELEDALLAEYLGDTVWPPGVIGDVSELRNDTKAPCVPISV
jgi:hypothetical protein